ncbi:MAG: efflux RND transporter periplasmic adaptor subunit [Candidatus Omnitrophica bacterium]|nr:efflux RND transporter periplasmic adaptor subunit [Candidatus Omnitrophota bacterium]
MDIKLKIKNEKVKIFAAIKLIINRLKASPRLIAGIIVIIALLITVSAQYRIRERIFKKPSEKTVKGMMSKETESLKEPVLVKVYKTQRQNFEDKLPLLGTLQGFKEIDLKFETNGILDSFNFKEGERIEKGAVIAMLNQKDALLKLRYNEIEMEKIQKLFEMGAVSKSKLEQANVEMESAKREVDKTCIYAPTSGALGAKDAEIGEFVTSNDRIGTLIDDKGVFIELGIIQKDVGKVKIGQNGKVIIDTYPDKEFDGVIDAISPVIEGKSRTQNAKLKLDNPGGLLLPGMFARASVIVYSATGVIVIPNTAVDKTDKGYVAYVVKKAAEQNPKPKAKSPKPKDKKAKEEENVEEESVQEDTVEARPITAGYRSADFFVVDSGLGEGEQVVVETQEKLQDGSKIIVTDVQEAIF